jgi:hypothetical protein
MIVLAPNYLLMTLIMVFKTWDVTNVSWDIKILFDKNYCLRYMWIANNGLLHVDVDVLNALPS